MTIFNRIDKLEQAQRSGLFDRQTNVTLLTDEQLFEIILKDQGMPTDRDAVAGHVLHFNSTGELPVPTAAA
ncbi:MAG: hypothetical protein OSB00_06595 [Sphingomonas bacterium]|nr:hypothetical protein [Sphingomonas bacterium]